MAEEKDLNNLEALERELEEISGNGGEEDDEIAEEVSEELQVILDLFDMVETVFNKQRDQESLLLGLTDAVHRLSQSINGLIETGGAFANSDNPDMEDMQRVIDAQNRIMREYITSEAIPKKSRVALLNSVKGLEAWDNLQAAKERINARRAYKDDIAKGLVEDE